MVSLYKKCAECETIFFKKTNVSLKNWNTRSKYCSLKCSHKNTLLDGTKQPSNECRLRGEKNNKWKGGQIEKTCVTCNASYKVDPYRVNSLNCSKKCDTQYRKTNIEYKTRLSKTHRERFPTGHEFVRSFNSLLRTCARYAIWREEVLKRDDFTCAHCKKRGGKLHVDHKEPFIVIILRNNIKNYDEALMCQELWNIENGQTLCRLCHYKTPTFGSKALKAHVIN